MDGYDNNIGYNKLALLANEAFLRRAAMVDAPFMLKGSLVTRQYMTSPENRIPGDLDWVYLERLDDPDISEEIFNSWVWEITNLAVDDGASFRDFGENAFWRNIDYSMSDDFPTVNTDVDCVIDVDGKEVNFTLDLDISFNLDVEFPPVLLNYVANDGSQFILPKTTPLSLQVAWKLHQTITRPRFKDLYDMVFLVTHVWFDAGERKNMLQALVNECYQDGVDAKRLDFLLSGDWEQLFPQNSLKGTWMFWRTGVRFQNRPMVGWEEITGSIRNLDHVPEDLSNFKQMVLHALDQAGLHPGAGLNLPKPTVSSKKRGLKEDYSYYVNFNRDAAPDPTEPTNPWWKFW